MADDPSNNRVRSKEKGIHANTAAGVRSKNQEHSLERMECLLKQSAQGIHILFDNKTIAQAMQTQQDEKDFFDPAKMTKVQDHMTALVDKKSFLEKLSYLQELKKTDEEAHLMLIRTYFHIVENTVRSETSMNH